MFIRDWPAAFGSLGNQNGRIPSDRVDLLTAKGSATDLNVTADLTKRTIVCSMRLAAPQDKKRSSARVNWLAKQLTRAETESMFVKAVRPGRAEETQEPLARVLEDATTLESPATDVVPSAFEIFYMADLGHRFAGNKIFIEELEKAVPHFYQQVGQRLRAWVAPPPKLHRRDPAAQMDEIDEPAELAAADFQPPGEKELNKVGPGLA